jgi:hypothetical protein
VIAPRCRISAGSLPATNTEKLSERRGHIRPRRRVVLGRRSEE